MNTSTLIMNALTAGTAPDGPIRGLRTWLETTFGALRPARRSRTDEANEVRAFAARMRRSDPAFAADLYAAADRHDCLDETPPWR
jgi:hypothetical protein